MSVTVFVEGGGRNKDLRARCREGFGNFLDTHELNGRRPKIVACGSRGDAFDRFRTAIQLQDRTSYVLLVDSEELLTAGRSLWQHVRMRPGDGWECPESANEEHLHFMVVCMEAWLIADGDSLSKFYGRGFIATQLPTTNNLEAVEKERVLDSLKRATRGTKKGEYNKGKTSFMALGAIDIGVVAERMPHCKRFLNALRGT